jgi:hypothetical protein
MEEGQVGSLLRGTVTLRKGISTLHGVDSSQIPAGETNVALSTPRMRMRRRVPVRL